MPYVGSERTICTYLYLAFSCTRRALEAGGGVRARARARARACLGGVDELLVLALDHLLDLLRLVLLVLGPLRGQQHDEAVLVEDAVLLLVKVAELHLRLDAGELHALLEGDGIGA